mmetsp:Transcript_36914/g.91524  ORF Transcript_36914/g.91524 Transcript_36914/m.91524 type:complete len:123 (+) Transcript_36914:523-891(+)
MGQRFAGRRDAQAQRAVAKSAARAEESAENAAEAMKEKKDARAPKLVAEKAACAPRRAAENGVAPFFKSRSCEPPDSRPSHTAKRGCADPNFHTPPSTRKSQPTRIPGSRLASPPPRKSNRF